MFSVFKVKKRVKRSKREKWGKRKNDRQNGKVHMLLILYVRPAFIITSFFSTTLQWATKTYFHLSSHLNELRTLILQLAI